MNARGFSLLEILAVVAIMALAMGWVVTRQRAADSSIGSTTFAQDLVAFADAVKQGHSASDWRLFDSDGARQWAPAHWRLWYANGLRHQYGGSVTYEVDKYQDMEARALIVRTNLLPADVCTHTVVKAHGRFASVIVNETVLKSNPNDPIAQSAAAAACSHATNNRVFWVLL